MPLNGIDVQGLPEFRRALKAVDPKWPKALRDTHKIVAEEGASQSRRVASGMGGVKAKAARTIGSSATQRQAAVTIPTGARLGAIAFAGAKRHTGWYAAARYSNSAPQHAPWIGNNWDVAIAGQGPYAINDALAHYLPYLLEDFARMVDELMQEAFPSP